MSIFEMYFKLGVHHILDIRGYDHILFVVTLCAVYLLQQWRQILILVTAFTIGHSITLVLATFDIFRINSALVELLIPITILITAIANIIYKPRKISKAFHIAKYATALFFGLIHGMGFSNYLRSLLSSSNEIVKPLFAFNIGLELGQLVIVAAILSLAWLFVRRFKMQQREWNLVVSGAGLGISLILIIERL